MKNDSPLTILMYHYVRDYRATRFPEIKGLDIDEFREQLNYVKRYYNVVTMADALAWCRGEKLPPKPLLLTFDDAYLDHFVFVLPELKRLGLQGSFFAPVQALEEKVILDVNKIHVLLAVSQDKPQLLRDTFQHMSRLRSDGHIIPSEEECIRLAAGRGNRFDSSEVLLLKQILQRILSRTTAHLVLDGLLRERNFADLAALWEEIYMNEKMLIELKANGMFIGAHGYRHLWLDSLGEQDLEIELAKSIDFLKRFNVQAHEWTLCYPYGGYNDHVIDRVHASGFQLALATKVGLAQAAAPLALARLDTNDFPKTAGRSPNNWYYQA